MTAATDDAEGAGTPTRPVLLRHLAERLVAARADHPLRVAVDGICGSGKSTFAVDLVDAVRAAGAPALHVDSDGFHHVRAVRRRNTDDEARGYYDDAYDLDALATQVLRPLGPGGSRRFATTVHDLVTDEIITGAHAEAPADAVVVVGCTFLQRGELRELWDEAIYLDVPRPVALGRGITRDRDALGGEETARLAYERRYLAACDLYLAEERPAERASIVVEHSDPQRPVLVRG